MILQEKEIKILNKYLPENKIDDILNFQRLIDFICEKFKLTEEELSSKRRDSHVATARIMLVILTVKIYKPKYFEENGSKSIYKLPNGIGKILSIAINKNHTVPGYYYTKMRQYLETNQIDIEYIKSLEVEVLNKFEYKYSYEY